MNQRKPAGIIITTIASISLLVFIAISFVALPLIALLVGMAVGYILEVFTGDYVVHAFNSIGLADVQDGDLPKVFGLLAVVAALLKVGIGNGKKKTKSNE